MRPLKKTIGIVLTNPINVCRIAVIRTSLGITRSCECALAARIRVRRPLAGISHNVKRRDHG